MYLCYIDESGTPDDPNTPNFVLVGAAVPASTWKHLDYLIAEAKRPFDLETAEIHTGWMLRRYSEQEKIKDFEKLSRADRRKEVSLVRDADRLRTQALRPGKMKDLIKYHRKTDPFIHLTLDERRKVIDDIAKLFAAEKDARLFGQAIERSDYKRSEPIFEYAFERLVERFQVFLQNRAAWHTKNGQANSQELIGLLIQDNNETVCRRLTDMMRKFHRTGTFFRTIDRIVETPLFVDSSLTGMVQVADICSYAIRRLLDAKQNHLFNIIFPRVDRAGHAMVGLRHLSKGGCPCRICFEFRKSQPSRTPGSSASKVDPTPPSSAA